MGSSPLADVPCLPSGAASLHVSTGGSLSLSLMWRELPGQYQVTGHRLVGVPEPLRLLGIPGLVAHRCPAFEVARQMFVSENTVQDHLTSIFDKSTARSRRALLARPLGT